MITVASSPQGAIASLSMIWGLCLVLIVGGCSSRELVDVPPHLSLADNDIREIRADGRIAVVARNVPSDATRAVITDRGVVVDNAGSVEVVGDNRSASVATGVLLAADRNGQRIATMSNGILTIHGPDTDVGIPIPCPQPTAGVWDGSDAVIGLVCGQIMFVVDGKDSKVFSKELPGRGIDITNWGEGFAVLVQGSGDKLDLLRTPCHEQDLFGLLYDFDQDVVEVVGGIDVEGLIALTSNDSLLRLNPNGEFEKVDDDVQLIGEVPGVSLELRCELGTIPSQ